MTARSLCRFGVLVVLTLVPSLSGGQTPATKSPDARSPGVAETTIEATLQALARTIESQQKLLEEQARQIEQLRWEIAESRGLTRPASADGPSVQSNPPAEHASDQPPEPTDQDPLRQPELPPDLVIAGDFPGAIKLPGTDAALRIGGFVRANWVGTHEALLVDDKFQTSAIPVPGTPAAEQGGRLDLIASQSRFNFDLRTATGVGYWRAFIEGDFGGDNTTLELRHAFGQWRRFIFGQTWSTFADPEADPRGIDFEGLNAIVLFRQPQVRWSFPWGERTRIALALEDPQPALTDATPVNQVPDFITRLRWEPRRGGHIQVAGLFRQLRGEPQHESVTDAPVNIVSAGAYGFNVGGKLPSPLWSTRDKVLFQYNAGKGIGSYINDLRSFGGQDGVFDPLSDTLRPLVVFAGFVGYEHWWQASLRSSFSFGIVDVDNLDIQRPDALHRTRRSSVNLMWSPIQRLDLVTEFLWGRMQTKEGASGFASQTQIGSTFRF